MDFNNSRDTERLLKFAGKKIGMSPEKLKKDIEEGNFGNLNIPEDKKKQIGEILNNKEELDKILNNPNLKKLLDSLTKGGR